MPSKAGRRLRRPPKRLYSTPTQDLLSNSVDNSTHPQGCPRLAGGRPQHHPRIAASHLRFVGWRLVRVRLLRLVAINKVCYVRRHKNGATLRALIKGEPLNGAHVALTISAINSWHILHSSWRGRNAGSNSQSALKTYRHLLKFRNLSPRSQLSGRFFVASDFPHAVASASEQFAEFMTIVENATTRAELCYAVEVAVEQWGIKCEASEIGV